MKRCISMLLVFVLVFTMIPFQAIAVTPTTEANMNTGEMTVEGTNGFGTLLSQEINQSQVESAEAESEYDAGYSVIDLTFEGDLATVEYSSLEEAILVVALYSEDGMQMLASGTVEVSPEEDLAYVSIEGDMPEYFMASAYLVDTYDLSPLCAAYDTPMYTQEMQELLVSTIHDYDADRVLNLDEDETTNFAVYAEDTIVIEAQEGANTVASVDDENFTYVIENADESITSLAEGDVFVYPYGENEILIVKVASIEVEGTTVIITGDELEMAEVFSHVKISDSGETEDFEFDDTGTTEGVTFEGVFSEGDNVPALMAARGSSATFKKYAKFKFDHTLDKTTEGALEGEMKLTGSLNLSMGISVGFYQTAKKVHFEVRLFAEAEIDVSIDAKVTLSLPIPGPKYSNLAVEIGFKPEFIVEVSSKVFFKVTIVAEVVLTFGSNPDIRTKGGYDDAELAFEGTLFVGIDLNPVVKVAKGYLADLEVEMPVGLEIQGTLGGSLSEMLDPNTRHDCQKCLDIDFSFIAEYNIKFKLLNKKWPKMETGNKYSLKLGSMYLSLDNDAFGAGQCPYKRYKVVLEVRNSANSLMPDTEILKKDGTSLGKTSKLGLLAAWLPTGKTTFKATIFGEELQKAIKITEDDSGSKVVLKFGVSVSAKDYLAGAEDCIDDTIVYISGRCGDDLFWSLLDDGRLFITGTGPMWDYQEGDAPWYSERSSITEVWLGSGFGDEVTSIGDYAFDNCTNLTSVVNADSVTTIGDWAFSYCSLTNVTIPDSVTTIGSGAFYFCNNLESLTIGNRVTSIGYKAFSICSSLTSVEIPDSVTTIGREAFFSCDNLHSVTIGESVTTIGDYAFSFCNNLTSVEISDSVTTIGDYAFQYCPRLPNVEIPDSVTTIGDCAFSSCHSLTSVEIPDGVTTIGDSAFVLCSRLTGIYVNEKNPYYSSDIRGVLFDKEKTQLMQAPCAISGFYEVPGSVTSIGDQAFSSCGSLTSVEIPDSVATIGNRAFEDCYELEEIVFRGDAPAIGSGLFQHVTTTVYYPSGNTTWTSDVMKDYNGIFITWIPYTLDENGNMVTNETAAIPVTADTEQLSGVTEPTDILYENTIEDVPTVYAVHGGEYSSVVTDTYTLKTASFSGLVPDQQYVLLAMVSIDVEDPLAADNLLYIDQAEALEDGTLVFQYVQRTPTETSYVVVCGASSKNLNDAEITFPEMVVDSESIVVNPTVVYDGETLIEGQDYTIQGTVSVTEPGTYTCYIRGIRNYAGMVACIYEVISPYYEVASGTCGSNLTWTFYDNGRLTISGTGPMTEFSSMDSVPWDDRRSEIVTVIIDQGVTAIGDFAFAECTNLTSATIGKSVTNIGDLAFSECSSLASITIPDSVTTIGSLAFSDCSSLASVKIGNSVTTIGSQAFLYCDKLTSVTIPDSVTTIRFGAFEYCTNLASVTIGHSVDAIENGAFWSCTSLTSITIPENVTTISDNTFKLCNSLTGIHVDENNPNYSSDDRGVLFDKEKAKLIQAPGAISGSYEIPDSVTNIRYDAFYYCTNLTSVTIGESVTAIGSDAFGYCTNLTSVTIGESVTAIGSDAFGYCTNLTSVTIPESVAAIGSGAFGHCTSLTNVTIPGSVITIGNDVFERCNNLTGIYVDENNPNYSSDDQGVLFDKEKVKLIQAPGAISGFYEIPDSVTTIGEYAFRSCTGLTSMDIPNSVTTIGEYALSGCTSLSQITFMGDAPAIDGGAFSGIAATACYLASNQSWTEDVLQNYGGTITWMPYCTEHSYEAIVIEPTCTKQGYTTYSCSMCGDSYVEDETEALGHSYESVDNELTYTCITCGDSYTVAVPIGLEYGYGPDYIYITGYTGTATELVIPAEIEGLPVTEIIGEYAGASGCDSLTSVTIPNSVTTIGWYAFASFKNLSSISIPASVTTIGEGAFAWCESLTSIAIPASVTTIGDYAFRSCDSLTTIYFEGDAPAFGENVFDYVYATAYFPDNTTWTDEVMQGYGGGIAWKTLDDMNIPIGLDYEVYEDHVEITDFKNYDITELVIPAKIERLPVTIIRDEVFQYVDYLTNVTLPDSITYIGDSAFYGCDSLTTINIPDGITYIGDYAFYCCSNLTGRITIPVSLTSMGKGVFAQCDNLTSITIQDGVTVVIDETFSGCNGVTSISIPDTVTSIGARAFDDCDGVTSIDIPASVTSIGYGAFQNCSKLKSIRFNGDVPEFGTWVFSSVYGTAYYPGDNPTWTLEVMENCNDSSINWVAEGDVFGMEIVSAPECGIVGLAPDLSELCVELIYGNDMHRPVANSKLTISEINTSTAGKKNVTVSYDDFSAEFTYGVHEAIGVVLNPSLYPESQHDYGYNLNETQTLTWPGADLLELVFSWDTFVENNYDRIYVYDGKGNLIISYTGAGAAGVTLTVPGDTVKIRLTSDASITDYGYSFTSIIAKSASHTGTVIIPAVEATCTESGRTEGFICEICDQEQYTVIPALGHDYESAVTAPTCTEQGFTTYICSICGDTYTADEVAATGHSHSRYGSDEDNHWSICVCGKIIDGTSSPHEYIDGKCVCGSTWINVVKTRTDIVCAVNGQTVMVEHDIPCRVGYWDETSGKYVAITAVSNGDSSYSFTAPDGVTEVLVVVTGDANGDGRVSASDTARLNAYILGKVTLSAEELFAADVNYDGLANADDRTYLSNAILGKDALAW